MTLIVFLKNFSKYLISLKKNYPGCKELNPLTVSCGRLNMYDFVCGTMSHAKLPLHWSAIHYQVTFEWCSGHGLETSIL